MSPGAEHRDALARRPGESEPRQSEVVALIEAYAVEVIVESTAPPTHQYEQAGVTWYQGNKPVFKLVHEFIDGKTYVIPGKKPTETRRLQLRLIVSKDQYVAQYRADGKGEFQTAASGKLAAGMDEKISIQCYQGPADAEHWFRFSDFRILELPE